MADSNFVSTLNRLIETCRDGQEGYRTAAEDIEDTNLKSIFSSFSLQRAEFVGELQEVLISHGETQPEDDSSMTGSLHRGWINLKQALMGKERQAILNECERGENAAVDEYERALDADLPAPVRSMVEKQYSEIKDARDKVRQLREKAEATE